MMASMASGGRSKIGVFSTRRHGALTAVVFDVAKPGNNKEQYARAPATFADNYVGAGRREAVLVP